ncbi:MAG: gamma-glutamyl-gamma-aminobutyrate hydrolase family protein, partial [Akkermansia sp.]
ATMRLGAYTAHLFPKTLVHTLYGKDEIVERHRHRYEFNPNYRETIEQAGLKVSATSEGEGLVEVVELPGHPFYIACQYHPEFQSRPNHPHPLFEGLVSAALKLKAER